MCLLSMMSSLSLVQLSHAPQDSRNRFPVTSGGTSMHTTLTFKFAHSHPMMSSFPHTYTSILFFRYSPTPASLPLTRDRQRRSVSVCQNSFSPETPSPREVDALLRNTFAGSPSPLSQQCGDAQAGGEEEECVYDSLSQKLPPWKEGQERRGKEDNDVEREDCYVLMQSNAV